MELGIGSYTYPWAVSTNNLEHHPPFTAESILDKAVAFDVKRVQLADNLPLHQMHGPARDALRHRASANNIRIETGTKGLIEDHLLNYLAIAASFQSPFLRVIIDDENYHPSTYQVIGVINAVLPSFTASNVVLAIENHD